MDADKRTVAVLGYGRFGRSLCELVQQSGRAVRAFDPQAEVPSPLRADSIKALVDGAGLIILSVPVSALSAALETIRPHLTRSQLVIDVGSVKVGPTKTLRSALGDEIPWVATHPLFGPTSLARAERPLRVVLCPNELHPTATAVARRLYESCGCETLELDPETHDRTMARTHALAFFIAKALIDTGSGEDVPFTPPSYQAIARTIEAVRTDAGHLFLTLHRDNPHAGAARQDLIDALTRLDDEIRHTDGTSEAPSPIFAIPDLGQASPALLEVRDLIDEVDREMLELLTRRAELSRRAGLAKLQRGAAVRDPAREETLLDHRAKWAQEVGADEQGIRDIFEAILRFSRSIQNADR
jgi:prephenate dehydrogenase